MKKIFIAVITILSFGSNVTAQVNMPQPSTTQTIRQDFGMGAIELTYSRPNIKERKVFGDLVPFGKLWRTGANAATRIKFFDEIEINGKKIDSGTYVLYTIPNIDSWEIIINKGINNWGVDGYKDVEDVLRFKVIPQKIKNKTETFTMQFANVKSQYCELNIMWDKTAVTIPITTNIKEKLRSQIENALQTDKKPFWQAAQFYNEWDNNHTKALENVSKGIAENPKAFWMLLYKAKIQKGMGDVAGAKESAKQSLALAKEAGNADYVKMNEELLKGLK